MGSRMIKVLVAVNFISQDQTDEGFFDKLVDDEFGIDGSSAAELQEGNDSDGINDGPHPADTSLASLSLCESEYLSQVQVDEAVAGKVGSSSASNSVEFKPWKRNRVAEGSGSDMLVESNEPVIPAELVAHGAGANAHLNNSEADFPSVTGSKQSRSSVKEMQWSSFHRDWREHGTIFSSTSLQSKSQNQAGFVQGRTQQTDAVSGGLRSTSSSVFDGSPVPEVVERDPNGWVANCESEAHAHSTEGATSYELLQYSPEYWKSLYPGWRYDHNTGE